MAAKQIKIEELNRAPFFMTAFKILLLKSATLIVIAAAAVATDPYNLIVPGLLTKLPVI